MLLIRTMDGCLILNKLVRRRVKLFQRDGNTAKCNANCQNVSIFIDFFLSHPNNFAPLSPSITWARGSNSLKITWYENHGFYEVMNHGPSQQSFKEEYKPRK